MSTGAVTNISTTPSVLVVDDDGELLRGFSRILVHAGFSVDATSDGLSAVEMLRSRKYDVVLSDISMPGLDGIQLLRKIREFDSDLPVILVTATPTLSTAVRAIEYGATQYLIKPVEPAALEAAVRSAAKLHELGRVKREIVEHIGRPEMRLSDRPSVELSFERAVASLWMAYQPIVSAKDWSLFGYEALLRCGEPTLPSPGALIGAAERLNRLGDLGRAIRLHVAGTLRDSADILAFVNLHTHDLTDTLLYDSQSLFSSLAPRVVLEVTERASLDDVKDVAGRVAKLREMGFRIAIDDLGAGYAGLTSFAQLVPEVVKLDMTLVRDIDTDVIRRKLVRSMTTLCRDMGMLVVAEGIETRAELDVVVELGCDLLQGYYLGKPDKPFPAIQNV